MQGCVESAHAPAVLLNMSNRMVAAREIIRMRITSEAVFHPSLTLYQKRSYANWQIMSIIMLIIGSYLYPPVKQYLPNFPKIMLIVIYLFS
jgi:hypothetical protein